jgi:hypothetical protein
MGVAVLVGVCLVALLVCLALLPINIILRFLVKTPDLGQSRRDKYIEKRIAETGSGGSARRTSRAWAEFGAEYDEIVGAAQADFSKGQANGDALR